MKLRVQWIQWSYFYNNLIPIGNLIQWNDFVIQRKNYPQFSSTSSIKIFDLLGGASLFILAAYAGTLSTFSSGINSMATVVISDFLKPNELFFTKNSIPDKAYTWISKGISVFFGVLCISLTYVVSRMGDGILQKLI